MNGRNVQIRLGGPLTPVVKGIMITNALFFLLQKIIGNFSPDVIETYFGLSYLGIFQDLRIWQILTYMFLHGSWFHILFNLIGLWMFAGELEELWGSKQFLKYYMITGIGAGIFISLMNYFIYTKYSLSPITIGASGAIYGILLAYGLTWPNRQVLLYFVIPIKIKYLVIAFGVIEFMGTLSTITSSQGNISHIGHIGGIITGLIYIFAKYKPYSRRKKIAKKPINESSFSRFLKKHRLNKKKKEIEVRMAAKEIIDTLLDKIAKSGMSSLSERERKRLDWARKHYYPEEKETIH